MRTIFQIGLVSAFFGLCCSAVCSGRAVNTVSLEATSSETIVTAAQLSLAEARKSHSNPRAAVGWYLEAADRAMRAASESPSNDASEARLIYDSACEEVTVLLWSNHELWNKTDAIPFDFQRTRWVVTAWAWESSLTEGI